MKEFKKSDLKGDLTVEFRDGSTILARHYDFGAHNDNLTHTKFFIYDVVKVYENNPKLIWEREEPIVLNEKEKAILVAYSDYKWIARDKNNDLTLYINKPEKLSTLWNRLETEIRYYIPPQLFRFVKWEDEEPTSLDELRKGIKNEKN